MVAQTLGRVAALQERHQRSDLVVLDGARQGLLHLGRANALGGIAGDFTPASQVLEERAQRGRLAGDGCARVTAVAQVQEIRRDLVAIDRAEGEINAALAFGVGSQVVGELLQIVAIGRNGIRRQASLAVEVGQEGLDTLVHEPPRRLQRGVNPSAWIGWSGRAARAILATRAAWSRTTRRSATRAAWPWATGRW